MSLSHSDSNMNPNVLKSLRSLSGLIRSEAAAIEGSTKFRLADVRKAVFDLIDGDQAGTSSTTNILRSALRYESRVGIDMDVSELPKSDRIVVFEAIVQMFRESERSKVMTL